MKKMIICVKIMLLCLLQLLYCSCQTNMSFSVKMQRKYDQEDGIYLTVNIPNSGEEKDITFTIDGIVYAYTNTPTVESPMFMFSCDNTDDMYTIYLTFEDSEEGEAVLCICSNEGIQTEYYAAISEFARLTNYLRTN